MSGLGVVSKFFVEERALWPNAWCGRSRSGGVCTRAIRPSAAQTKEIHGQSKQCACEMYGTGVARRARVWTAAPFVRGQRRRGVCGFSGRWKEGRREREGVKERGICVWAAVCLPRRALGLEQLFVRFLRGTSCGSLRGDARVRSISESEPGTMSAAELIKCLGVSALQA